MNQEIWIVIISALVPTLCVLSIYAYFLYATGAMLWLEILIARVQFKSRALLQRLQMGFVWALPHWIIYWAIIRAGGHATSGKYGMTSPSEVRMMTVLKRWEAKK